MKPIINVANLYKSYDRREVLHGISFEVNKGECFCLLGPNGAGKTTTLKILTGFLTPDEGKVSVLEFDILKEPHKLKGKVNIIPQHPALDPFLSVEENLLFYGMLQKIDYFVLRKKIKAVIRDFELKQVKNQITFHLSGGEFQRLMVARSFLKPADIIFMDEPTSGIDILLKNKLWDFFKTEKGKGITIFLNTHDLNEAEVISDRIGFIFDGKLVVIDSPDRLKRMVEEIKIEIQFDKPIAKVGFLTSFKAEGLAISQKTATFIEIKAKEINSNVLKLLNLISEDHKIKLLEIKQPTLNDVFNKLGIENVCNNLA